MLATTVVSLIEVLKLETVLMLSLLVMLQESEIVRNPSNGKIQLNALEIE